MRLHSLLSLLFIIGFFSVRANNIQVSNVGYDPITEDLYEVFFDISWENSWRTSTFESNYDAAWVFVKFKTTSNPDWTHAFVYQSGEPAPTGAELIFPSDAMGVFVQRSSNGIGDVTFSDVQLEWQPEDPIDLQDRIEICVYAIEMVFVPEGAFQVGDGGTGHWDGVFQAGSTGSPLTITSESQITLGGSNPLNLGTTTNFVDDFNTNVTYILPSSFPKGYQAFYIMKYEISQGQYATFLNSIDYSNQFDRKNDSFYDSSGQTIRATGRPSQLGADAPNRAANYLNWADIAMYADWSGLRPMTELEFEKACRGSEPAVAKEFAWGTQFLFDLQYYQFGTTDEGNEIILNPSPELGNALSANNSTNRPADCGIFAYSSSMSTRQHTGASYYGIMELSGNVSELIITVGNPEGRSFHHAAHGDGQVDAPVTLWPAVEGAEEAIGTGYRGGSWDNSYYNSFISSRGRATNEALSRDGENGGRLVRSDF